MADTGTAEQQKQALDWLLGQAKSGAAATSAPATQKVLARWNDDKNRTDPDTGEVVGPGFDFYKNPNFIEPKPAAGPSPVSGSQFGTYGPDPNNPGGPWIQVVPPQVGTAPNADEDVSKAIKRQNEEAERNERIANEQAGRGYTTAKEAADIANMGAQRGFDAQRIALETAKFGQQQKDEDRKAAIEAAKLPGTLAQTAATTAKIGAEAAGISATTDLTRAQIDALGIKTASDADRALKAGLLDQAQTDKIKQELLKPEAVATTADQPFVVRRDPQTGQQIVEQNPNYQGPKAPTTRGELAQRVALLQTQAAQMKDKIAADKSIPPDQQAARLSSWWDQNIAPQASALEQQQQAIIADETQKALEQQRTSLTSASTAMQGLMPYRVGPGYGQAFEKIVQDTANTKFPGQTGAPLDLGTGWSTFKGPSIDQNVQNLLNAPAVAPAPGMDIQGMLNRNQWTPGGAPPPGAGAPPQPATAAAAGYVPRHDVYPGLAQGGPRPLPQTSYTIPGLNPAGMPGSPSFVPQMPPELPQAAPMPIATGAGPLAYNPAVFRGVAPLLAGYDYSQMANQYPWQFGGGGSGGAGFTPGP